MFLAFFARIFSGLNPETEQWVILSYKLDPQENPIMVSVVKASSSDFYRHIEKLIGKNGSIPDLGPSSLAFRCYSSTEKIYHWLIKLPEDFAPLVNEASLKLEPQNVDILSQGPFFGFARLETDSAGFITKLELIFLEESLKEKEEVLRRLLENNLRIDWRSPGKFVFFVSFKVHSGKIELAGWLGYKGGEK